MWLHWSWSPPSVLPTSPPETETSRVVACAELVPGNWNETHKPIHTKSWCPNSGPLHSAPLPSPASSITLPEEQDKGEQGPKICWERVGAQDSGRRCDISVGGLRLSWNQALSTPAHVTERTGSALMRWAVHRPEEMWGLAYLYYSSILQLSPRAFSAQGWANLHGFHDLQAGTANILQFAKQLFAKKGLSFLFPSPGINKENTFNCQDWLM